MITETVLKDATEKILQTIADKIYDLVPYDSTEISEILEISDYTERFLPVYLVSAIRNAQVLALELVVSRKAFLSSQ